MFVLVAIYYIAVNISIPSSRSVDVQKKSDFSETHFSAASSASFVHDFQSESVVTNSSSPAQPTFKNPFQEFCGVELLTQHIFETQFTQYTRLLRNSLILRSKVSIIFPSHYFW